MAKFNQVERQLIMPVEDIIRFQLVFSCLSKNISLSNAEINCLVYLATLGEHDLSDFCELVVEKEIFSSTQTVRNCIVKLEKLGFIVKSGKSKQRVVSVSSELKIQAKGNIFVNYKLYHVQSN